MCTHALGFLPRTEPPMAPVQRAGLQTLMKIAGGCNVSISIPRHGVVRTSLLIFSMPCTSCLPKRGRLTVDALQLALTVLGRPRIERSRSEQGCCFCHREAKRREARGLLMSAFSTARRQFFSGSSQQHIRYPPSQVRERDARTTTRAGVCPVRICDRIFRSSFPLPSCAVDDYWTGMLCPQREGSPRSKPTLQPTSSPVTFWMRQHLQQRAASRLLAKTVW